MANTIIEEAKAKMVKAEQALGREFGTIRAGRANASYSAV